MILREKYATEVLKFDTECKLCNYMVASLFSVDFVSRVIFDNTHTFI